MSAMKALRQETIITVQWSLYAENIKNNVEELETEHVDFMNPFMAFTNEKIFNRFGLAREFGKNSRSLKQRSVWQPTLAGKNCWHPVLIWRKKGKKPAWMKEHGKRGIVLAGRPLPCRPGDPPRYPELIASYGFAVLTEDSVSHMGKVERPLVVTDQWMYHSRLYEAASFVKTRDDLDLIQLNSLVAV